MYMYYIRQLDEINSAEILCFVTFFVLANVEESITDCAMKKLPTGQATLKRLFYLPMIYS